MKTAEFFAGSCSFSKEAKAQGHETFTNDIISYAGIKLVKDFLLLVRADIPYETYERIALWFSPDCSSWSIAACSHHRKYIDGVLMAKSEKAKIANLLLKKVHEVISWFPNAIWFIENPRGLMRKDPSMQNLPRHTVTYCQYGDTRMKPTDIWTNSTTWKPRPMCKNGGGCHESAPRGAKTGTQGRKGSYERSKLPPALCKEIVESLNREGE